MTNDDLSERTLEPRHPFHVVTGETLSRTHKKAACLTYIYPLVEYKSNLLSLTRTNLLLVQKLSPVLLLRRHTLKNF